MSYTILVIDDTTDIIKMVRTVLLAASYKTLVATSGDKGISIAETANPDLILLDIMMPGKDGYETCKELKENIKTSHIPIIFISALDNSFDKVKAFSIGAVDYVPKPIEDEELLARIYTHISISKYKNELEIANIQLNKQNIQLHSTIKELESTQAKLLHSEKMISLGILAAGIAHEINNPINFVAAGSSALRDSYKEIQKVIDVLLKYENLLPENIKSEINDIKTLCFFDENITEIPQIIDDICVGAERISEIVRSLGLYLHNDIKNKKEVDLHDVIQTAILILSNKIKYKINIIKEYDNSAPSIICFSGQLNQVFVNLLGNAIDAIKDEGTVIIRTKYYTKSNNFEISFIDNGEGISETNMSKIFDPFFTTKDVGSGIGLGLYISYEIIKTHNGKIEVSSNQNIGTEFKITIPRE